MVFKYLILLSLLSSPSFANEALLKTAQEHTIICKDEACNPAVGTLVALGMFGRTFCRASILNANTVITAAHCVEDYIETKNCEGEVYFKFGNEVAECGRIKQAQYTLDRIDLPDYAIIELKKPLSVPPLSSLRTAFQDEQNLYFYKSSYDFETNSSTLEKINCKSKKLSTVTGMFYSERPETISISDCNFEEGDSGSPIFNEEGQLVAILHGGIVAELRNKLASLKMPNFNNASYLDVLRMHSDSPIEELKTVISATTLTCIDSPDLNGEFKCEAKSIGEYAVELVLNLRKEYIEKLSALLPAGSFEVEEALYMQLLSKPSPPPEQLKPSDYVDSMQPKLNCDLIPKGALIPVQRIHTKVDTYLRLLLDSSYEAQDLCAK